MKQNKLIPTLLSILFIAIVWQILSFKVGYPAIFPSLADLVKKVFSLFVSEDFHIALLSTIFRGIIGFFIALVMGFIFATIAVFSPFWKAFFHPIIVIGRSIPVISFVLLAILWFSPPYLPVFVGFVTMFPVLYQNILTGLEQTDVKWVEMARVFGKSPYKRFVSIYLPASKSIIYDGVSTAMGFGWRAVIIGEVLAQPIHGIGTEMKQAQAFINVSELIGWTVIAVGVSYLFEGIIRWIRRIRFTEAFPNPTTYVIPVDVQYAEIKEIKAFDLDKRFNNKIVFHSFSSVFDTDTVSYIKGPSGKGKTTLLRMLAQLEKPDVGSISFSKLATFAYSFQDVRLLPWLTVFENVAFAVHSKHIHKQEISNLVAFLLEKMELTDQGHKYPHELSGGQQQRVGLARALAACSDVLLLDEPLTGLDNALKERLQDFLSVWIVAYRPVVIWATHEKVHLKDIAVREVVL